MTGDATPPTVLILHARREEDLAEALAGPLRAAGYAVEHEGTVLVGDSVLAKATEHLSAGAPVVLCGTERAAGNRPVALILNAARARPRGTAHVYIVQMEEEADLERFAFGTKIADYDRDPAQAIDDLLAALRRDFPVGGDGREQAERARVERKYRELMLSNSDIVNLSNLPQPDRHLAGRQSELKLRRLYIPLRAELEAPPSAELDDEGWMLRWEEREGRRRDAWRGRGGSAQPPSRVAIAARLAAARRLVVLGDPGSGKTTLTRWLATVYLLRLDGGDAWRELPDAELLPPDPWLPIILRCRDLSGSLDGSLEDMLRQTLRKLALRESDLETAVALLMERLEAGRALLMIDGLDEITDPTARARFSEHLERIVDANSGGPVVVTSRIVGYREMAYRLGRGFEHLTLSDLETEEKDAFVRRWAELTETPDSHQAASEALIADIHSSDRIERLTGNPMLLTTMALVRRNVGKLPSRRADLYTEATKVLLHWRAEVDAALDEREALPQLAYLAYAMCARGVQQLAEDEALALLGDMRGEYPNLHAVAGRGPLPFLRLVEARTGLLVQAGLTRHRGRLMPVYEFRHLTFQEYLAAYGLVNGYHPGYMPTRRPLAERVAPLAGYVAPAGGEEAEDEMRLTENWREALRLCAVLCGHDEVDGVVGAILTLLPGEPPTTARPRATIAALCVADEPFVGKGVIDRVFATLAGEVRSEDREKTTAMDAVVTEMAHSRWADRLADHLIDAFLATEPDRRWALAMLTVQLVVATMPEDEAEVMSYLRRIILELTAAAQPDIVRAAFATLAAADRPNERWRDPRPIRIDGVAVADRLLWQLSDVPAVNHAVLMAFVSIDDSQSDKWMLSSGQLKQLLARFQHDADASIQLILALIFGDTAYRPALDFLVRHLNSADKFIRLHSAAALGKLGIDRAVKPLIGRLDDPEPRVREAAAEALSKLGSDRAVEPLIARLDDAEAYVRSAAASALGRLGSDRAVEPLIARLDDAEAYVRRAAAAEALGNVGSDRAVEPLLARLDDAVADVRSAAAYALGNLQNDRALRAIIARLNDADERMRRSVVGGLSRTLEDADQRLLSRDLDGLQPFLDPRQPITLQDVERAARQLELDETEVRARYEALAERFGLRLAWRETAGPEA